MRFNFVEVSTLRNFFNTEIFPIYGTSKMIHHRSSSNISLNSYFCRMPRLWNSLPPIDLTLPIPIIKHKLFIFYGTILPNTLKRTQSALIIITAPAVTVDVQVQDHHYLTDYHSPLLIVNPLNNYLINYKL